MEEVKINDVPYLRTGVQSITYDPKSVTFINGIGVAKANIVFGRNEKYECYGLINEQGEEVFSDKETYAERSLMFLPYVQKITRVSDNDFICQILCGEDGYTRTELRHIRLEGNTAERVDVKISSFELADIPDLMIVNNTLYKISEAKFVSNPYLRLHYLGEGEFSVKDVITSLECDGLKYKNKDTAEYDYFHFRINQNDERTTGIFSKLMCDFYPVDKTTPYKEIKEQRTEELKQREAKIIAETAILRKENN